MVLLITDKVFADNDDLHDGVKDVDNGGDFVDKDLCFEKVFSSKTHRYGMVILVPCAV